MLFPVMGMFFVSPAISSHAKGTVTECLKQCLLSLPSGPTSDLLRCVLQIATKGTVADVDGQHQLLKSLQQVLSGDSCMGDTPDAGPILHCVMAVVQYMKFYNCASATKMKEMVFSACALLFPAILADVASQEELVAISADHGLEQISIPLLLEYGTVLLQCSAANQAVELAFKLMGSQLPLKSSSTHALVGIAAIQCYMYCMLRSCMQLGSCNRIGTGFTIIGAYNQAAHWCMCHMAYF